MQYQTQFGSLDKFQKGTIELINDKAKHYVFSNVFDVASRSKPYEKVVVGKNLQYVHYIKLDDARNIAPANKEGSVRIQGTPSGKKMGLIKLKRGHQALLPAGAAYQFRAKKRGVLLLQTILGENSVEKWADICHQ